jgi:hypothetical protein
LRDATWPINQPPLVKTCSNELGKDEKWEPLLPKNTLADNAIFLRLVCKKKKWLHAPLVQASTKLQPWIWYTCMSIIHMHVCLYKKERKKELNPNQALASGIRFPPVSNWIGPCGL